jgi:signal peptidase I
MENKEIKDSQEDVYYGVGSFLWEVVKVFLWAMIIIIPIRIFLFQPFFVQGASMEPSFMDSDYLIVNEFGYKITDVMRDFGGFHLFTIGSFKELQRGDVVVFRYPKNPSSFFIKRVIALPGEQIKVEDGKIQIVNPEHPAGYYLDEKMYLSSDVITNGTVSMSLSSIQYFVMGDNRGHSSDSRAWGAVPEEDIVGKVLLRAWPINKIEVF